MRVEFDNSIQQKIIKRNWYMVIRIGILLFLQYIIIPVDAHPSTARWGHASALINTGLYVYGGRTAESQFDDTSNVNELLYLDVSKPFNPAEPPWEIRNSLLETGEQPPFLSFHSCSVGGNQNELLILFGGSSRDQDPGDNPLFEYNTTTGEWLNLTVITANTPSRRSDHTIVTTSNSISYLWGGTPVEADGANGRAFNELYKLTTRDTISWELSAAQNTVGRWGHSATLLSDGKMYIIGGSSDGNDLVSMTEIFVYDTIREIWTIQTAIGNTIPPQRRGHRAVGTADNRIIIYGGTSSARDTYFDDIAVLKVAGDVLTWETHTVTGNKPPGRFDHSMTLVGSKAIVTYGLEDNFFDTETKLFIFDTDSYTWEQTYNPSPSIVMQNPVSPTDVIPTDSVSNNIKKDNSNNNNLGLIVGVPVAGGVVILVLVGLLFCYIRKRKRQPQFSATPYEKQQASIPPIAGPAPYNLSNFGPSSPSQGGTGTTNNAPFIPPFASTSHQRQPSIGSLNETRILTPVDQHDSWGSAPSNSSQSQLPQINPNISTTSYYKPFTSRPTSPLANPNPNVNYLPQTQSSQYYSNIPTPPPSTPTPPSISPPVSPQKDIFTSNVAAGGTSSSTKTSSSNLRLDSDSNTAPVEFDFNLPPVAPLSINRTRTPSPSQAQVQAQEQEQTQTQAQAQQLLSLQLPISTSSSSSSLLQNSSNDLVSSPIEMEATETTTAAADEGADGSFNSPLFRTEALSALAGTAASASLTDRTLSLRSVPRINTSTPRNSTSLSSPPPFSAGSRLRSGTFEGQRTHDGSATNSSRPTSPTYNNTPDDQQPRGRLFVANPDPSDSE